ncbi:MAG TPA: stage II sporulation protein R [Clostridium sp.]|jgi:stage II sporulation protein R|uniref:Stage II sporulation protein R n=1 Tax=Clostridium lapidicellarium TaxID=3240931 RepID=A0ABV4DTT9_9CLOT|nr:stage II sporulation protein R [uncultured Clostridium sp.]HBC95629.1 stage II sporulation protein R [Clostridium sp.]
MKKYLLVFIIGILSIFAANSVFLEIKNKNVEEDMASRIIRFHVIANSDSGSDQALKLRVRDRVLEYIAPKLENSEDINKSRKILKENDSRILEIANNEIRREGYSYKVNSTLSETNFPIKTYGNITLPPGKYEAYRIIIGSGQGQNWWCVMFPPLCFVDITKGQVSYKKTEDEMKKVLTPEEYKMVDNSSLGVNKKDIKLKFKLLEILKDMGYKISKM